MTSNEFIEIVRQQASIPVSQVTFLDVDILRTADGEMQTFMLPFMDRIKSEFFLWNDDQYYLAGARYRVHSRAVGATLRDVKLLIGDATDYREVSLDRVPYDGNEEYVSGYYMRGQYVRLIEPLTPPYAVRLVYVVRPNRLVTLAEATTIVSKDSINLTLAGTPSGFKDPITFDIVHGREPFDFCHNGFDRVGILNAGVISVTDGLGTLDFAVGDYVALKGESPVVMLPEPAAWLLAQQVAVRCLEAMGDSEGMVNAAQVEAGMIENVTHLLSNRVKGDPPVIVSPV